MKIGQIIPWYPSLNPSTIEAGQGIFWHRQALKLSERGHRIKVIAIKWRGQSDYERINGNIEVFRVPCILTLVKYPLPELIALTKKIMEIYGAWSPDIIIYNHVEYLTAVPSLLLKNRWKVPIIATIDSLPGVTWFCGNKIIDSIGYFNSMLVTKRIFKISDGIQFLSSDLYNYTDRLGIDISKTKVITTGVDTDIFRPGRNYRLRKELGIEDKDIVVLYVGRLELIKGLDSLFKAANTLIPRHDNIKFLIVGDGSLRRRFEAESSRYSGKIIFTGYRTDIPELMGAGDIFVLPSLSEGAPNVIMEASSSGLPVIATDVGESSKLVMSGVTGFIIKPRAVEDLIAKITMLAENSNLRNIMGQRGREWIVNSYSWNTICNRLEEFYGETTAKCSKIKG